MKSRKYTYNTLEVMRGNNKIGLDTLILNMGSATSCPSKALGLCKLGNKCYALKAERLYKDCLPYRTRQAHYWLNNDGDKIIEDFEGLLTSRRTKVDGVLVVLRAVIKYIRLNESGDFYTQECITKAEQIAKYFWQNYKIQVYTYTARADLDYENVRYLLVKGSGHDKCPNGMTIARPKAELQNTYNVLQTGIAGINPAIRENDKTYLVCPGDCRDCYHCKTRLPGGPNIVFAIH